MEPFKFLIGTSYTQGQRASDFCFTITHETVYLDGSCDRDHGDPDGPCGCVRSFTGIHRGQATTTARVVWCSDRPSLEPYCVAVGTLEQYASQLARALKRAKDDPSYDDGGAMCERLLKLAAAHPVGTVLERRGEELFAVRVPTKS